jgi:hypothetical protein
MSFLADRRRARRRDGEPGPSEPAACPTCGLRIEADEHAVHVRRAAYHADCVLYTGGRIQRDRWTLRS